MHYFTLVGIVWPIFNIEICFAIVELWLGYRPNRVDCYISRVLPSHLIINLLLLNISSSFCSLLLKMDFLDTAIGGGCLIDVRSYTSMNDKWLLSLFCHSVILHEFLPINVLCAMSSLTWLAMFIYLENLCSPFRIETFPSSGELMSFINFFVYFNLSSARGNRFVSVEYR